ncbi:MAG: hypothetical protein QGF21_08240 [Vicinamibacterales bacterium]|jgi:hypothetical protein|nr:hypothetical protein [Acidobacteriota bacterium]MDP7471636.1 hypothetical protein [Vicinamibacterales bacterium]MDP7671918.1 hypothetical protein [Vicinamibacterales bacterium]HJO37588.1 hypothetical protein [Vicinamibacterales bacterium]|tara:strand:+ start:1824 stop:2417 length:594 start_codon:yes stop_codon:yes gene_type:complete
MLRTNLATRPFYNERGIHVGLVALAIVVVGLTGFNVTRIVELSRSHTDLGLRVAQDEAAAREMVGETEAVRLQIDGAELRVVTDAVREANGLIGLRMFSWTELFNRIETTLPPDVMLTSVRPEVDGEYVSVAMVVLGRRIEAIDRFIEALEATGSFEELLARQEEATDDGMFRTVLRGRYLGVAAAAVGAQPAEPGP